MRYKWIMMIGISYFISQSCAQSPTEILRRTVEASGGDIWQQPRTLLLQGTAVFTPFGKTDSAHLRIFDRYSMYRIYPSENKAAHQANGKIRFDAFSGKDVFMQLIYDGKQSINQMSDEAKKYQVYFSWSNNFGFGIIRFANQDSFKVERLADDQVNGHNCFTIQITDPKKMVTTFLIDQKRYLIRGMYFLTSVGFHHRIYDQFRKIKTSNGFFVQPGSVKLFFDGVKWMDIHWKNNQVNMPIPDELFTQNNTEYAPQKK